MSKRALMLTVAAAALLSGAALGADDTDIKTKVTQPIKTSTANNGSPGDILIESGGSVVVTTAGPAVEIDSPNTVTNKGTISNIGTDDAIGVRLDATAAGNGPGATATALDSTGTIDLTGDKGTAKTAILVGIANSDTTGIFNGGINMETGSTLKVTGDSAIGVAVGNSTTLNGAINLAGTMTLSGGTDMTGVLIGTTTGSATPATVNGDLTFAAGSATTITGDNSLGVHVTQNSVLNGNLDLEGTLTMAPTTANSSSSGGLVGIQVDSNTGPDGITGNLTIGTSSAITATGSNSEGVVLLSGLGGNFTNSGTIIVTGTTTGSTSSSTANAVGGSAVIIADNVGGGILNNGPISSTDTATSATIEGNGAVPVLLISPAGGGATPSGNLTVGQYNGSQQLPYGLINYGTITASPTNPDQASTITMRVEGAGNFTTTITDGIFSSGKITAGASGDNKQASAMTVTAVSIGTATNIPVFVNSNQNSASPGTVTAAYSGTATGGSAVAIEIDAGGSLQKIVNQGTIGASATNTDTAISSLIARGIWDQSGTLAEVDNSGTINTTATTLDNGEQATIAIDMGEAVQNTKIDNSGTIIGNVNVGSGADTILVHGSTDQAASITGDIAFGGTSSALATADDILEVDDHGTVMGAVSERAGGRLDVAVNPGGVLTLTNDSIDPTKRFEVNNLTVGSGGTLGLGLSQTYNIAVNPTAGGIVTASGPVTLDPQAILNLPFQGFLAAQKPGDSSEFILIDAPLNELTLNLPGLQNQVCANVPFLFVNTGSQCLATQNNNDRSQLVLTLTPKTGAQIGLTGYALKMFPLANLALANDDQLGAAVIQAGNPVNGVPLTQAQGQSLYQGIYSQFAPNVTGASRALAIAITDQATGPVGARQRELRMYAGQPGDTTLWGQEFNLSLNADADANTIGYRDTGFGLAMGMDGGDPANGRYGGALTIYSGDINEKQPRKSKTNSEWAVLTGYSDWRGRGLFLDTQISAGVGQLDGKRLLQVSGVDRSADGKRDALLGSVGATTGVILTMGSTVFTPMMSLDGLAMREEGYTENGGGDPNSGDAFDLKVSPNYYDSARAFIGADVRQDLNLGDFYLQPEARGGYRYDFLANAEKVKASFASTPGTDFTLSGPDPDKGNLVLGGSLATTTGAWSIGVNYDYIRGTQGSVSQEGTLTLVGRI